MVQGIVDFDKGTTEARVSDIIDFEKTNISGNWQQWLTLLGWVVGKPVGNTKTTE